MILAELDAELARAIDAAVAGGTLPAQARLARATGTWRPPRGNPPGSYATSLPFQLAVLAKRSPANIAAQLAVAVRAARDVDSAEPTGGGYLTITVTAPALAAVAVTTTRAGSSCARSDALRGISRAAPPLPDLAAPTSWRQAWTDQAAALGGRLAEAAGATVSSTPHTKRSPLPDQAATANPGTADAAAADPSTSGQSAAGPGARHPAATVAGLVRYAGVDVVRYGLARMPADRAGKTGDEIRVSMDLESPFYLVSFAHADAASVARWAADLGLSREEPDGRLAGLLSLPPEGELLTQLSWFPERVAGAARRNRPDELGRYLEELAGAWLACRESCPALPFGGLAALRERAGISARLWLAEATRTVLAAGLGLVGVAAPRRV